MRLTRTSCRHRSKELFYTIRVLPPDTELVCGKQEEERKVDEEEVKEQEFADCTEEPLV